MRSLLVAIAALGLLPATAQAVTLTYDDGSPAPALQAWADASLVPMASGAVTVHRALCPDALASPACIARPGSEMWLQTSAPMLRRALLHELGHRFDYLVMTDAARAAFGRLMNDRRPWTQGPESLMERFASAYSACARHRIVRVLLLAGEYGYVVTGSEHRRACRLIRRTAQLARHN